MLLVIMSPVCDSVVLERRRRDPFGSLPPHSDQVTTGSRHGFDLNY